MFEEADQQFDLVFSMLKTSRSLAVSYNLQNNIQCAWFSVFGSKKTNVDIGFFLVFIHVQNDIEAALLESQIPMIVTLIKGCKSAQVVRSMGEIPEGCGASVVTAFVTVHTLVKGLVDLDVEIAKCKKKLDLAVLNRGKIVKMEAQLDYVETVPENVRLANEEKVCLCVCDCFYFILFLFLRTNPTDADDGYDCSVNCLRLRLSRWRRR